jgi:exoribonuclease R
MVKESKESHQLIEEFMLLANRTVAENVAKLKINKKPLPFPYRIHDRPDVDKLTPFMRLQKNMVIHSMYPRRSPLHSALIKCSPMQKENRNSMCWNS